MAGKSSETFNAGTREKQKHEELHTHTRTHTVKFTSFCHFEFERFVTSFYQEQNANLHTQTLSSLSRYIVIGPSFVMVNFVRRDPPSCLSIQSIHKQHFLFFYLYIGECCTWLGCFERETFLTRHREPFFCCVRIRTILNQHRWWLRTLAWEKVCYKS